MAKQPPVEFVQGLKLELPDISDQMAISIYNKAMEQNPELEMMEPIQLGTNVAKATKKSLEQYSNQPQSQPASASVPQVNTELKSPFAGTAMAQRNPDNPQAELMDQFDPQALRAAYADYAKKYDASLPARQVSTYFSARGSGGADAVEKLLKSQEDYNKYSTVDKQIAAADMASKGVTNATALQNQAKTAGEYQLKQAEGQQGLIQSQHKTEAGSIDLANKKLLNDPKSIASKAAQENAKQQWKRTHPGQPEPKFDDLSFNALANFVEPKFIDAWKKISEGRTAEAGADVTEATTNTLVQKPVPGTSAPNQAVAGDKPINNPGNLRPVGASKGFMQFPTLEAGQEALRKDIEAKASQGLNTISKIISKYAPPNENATESYIKDVAEYLNVDPNKVLEMNPAQINAIQHAIVKREQGGKAPVAAGTDKPTLTPEGKTRLQFSSINAGPVTIPPDPLVVAGAASDAAQTAEFEKRTRAYNTTVAPVIADIRQKLESSKLGTGMGTELFSRIMPGEARGLVSMLNQFNAMYPGVLQSSLEPGMSKAIDKAGFNGVVPSLSTSQVRDMLQLIERTQASDVQVQQNMNKGAASGARPGQYNANQPVPNTTPKSPGGSPVVRTQEEYDKLEPGTVYFHAEHGVAKRKPK